MSPRPTYKLMVLARCIQTADVVTKLLPAFRSHTLSGNRPAIHFTGYAEEGSLRGIRVLDGRPRVECEWVPHHYRPDTAMPEWAKTMVKRVTEEGAT